LEKESDYSTHIPHPQTVREKKEEKKMEREQEAKGRNTGWLRPKA